MTSWRTEKGAWKHPFSLECTIAPSKYLQSEPNLNEHHLCVATSIRKKKKLLQKNYMNIIQLWEVKGLFLCMSRYKQPLNFISLRPYSRVVLCHITYSVAQCTHADLLVAIETREARECWHGIAQNTPVAFLMLLIFGHAASTMIQHGILWVKLLLKLDSCTWCDFGGAQNKTAVDR